MDERERTEAIRAAMNEASELESKGDESGALGRLRRAIKEHSDGFEMSLERRGESIHMEINAIWLVLRTREAFLSLVLGQHSKGAHHGWLHQYEMASPLLPEGVPELRYWMDRLRILAAVEHEDHLVAAAWAYDLEDLLSTEGISDSETPIEALSALALASSALGFPKTAETLYQQASELPVAAANRARVQLNYGSFLFSIDPEQALGHYDEVIATLDREKSPTTGDLQMLALALRRRADCRFRTDQSAAGLEDSGRGLEYVDRARAKGRYTAIRSVDRAIGTDVDLLLDGVARCSLDRSPETALGMFLRAANSAVGAALRGDPTALRQSLLRDDDAFDASQDLPPDAVYLPDDDQGTLVQLRLSRFWTPIDETTIEATREAEPTLMIAATGRSTSHLRGFSLLAADGSLALLPWQVDNAGDEGGTLRQLLLPAPERPGDNEDSAWNLPADSSALATLAEEILPIVELRPHLDRGLRIAPLGAMWNFPFACLPIDGVPLGARAPFVLSVPLTANTPPPAANGWAAHFDHTLVYALRDQRNATRTAAALGAPMWLVDRGEDLRDGDIGVFLFSGHGTGQGASQRLWLSSGENLYAPDLRGTALGSSFILNACWSGNVIDITGTDPVDLPLSLLAHGAHSVWAAFGSVGDRQASLASEALLRELGPDLTMSQAAQQAFRVLLTENPTLPLRNWATHSTIGRSTEYLDR